MNGCSRPPGAGFAYQNSGLRGKREPAGACIALFASPSRSPILPRRSGCSSMAEQKLRNRPQALSTLHHTDRNIP